MKVSACPFEKAILASQYNCNCSRRGQRGERALIECENSGAAQDCLTYLKLVRYNSRFVLRINRQDESLPFGKQSKLLYGALQALTGFACSEEAGNNRNIHALLAQAVSQYDTINNLPYDIAAGCVSAYTPGRRRR